MKFLIFLILTLLSTSIDVYSQELEFNASSIKKQYPIEYEQIIKTNALKEWKDDFPMVVFEINRQCNALVELINDFKSENTNIAFKSIQEWSNKGFLDKNINVFQSIKTFGLMELIKINCDWTMVKFEYDRQVKAKNSF